MNVCDAMACDTGLTAVNSLRCILRGLSLELPMSFIKVTNFGPTFSQDSLILANVPAGGVGAEAVEERHREGIGLSDGDLESGDHRLRASDEGI